MKKVLAVVLCVVLVSSVGFAQNILLKEGDQYAGVKLALIGVGGASAGFVGSYERGLQDNIGIGATIGYSGYSEDLGFGAKWSYTNIYIVANGTYHLDLFKNEKLDTWGALHLGYNVASVKWEGAGSSFGSPSVGGVVIGLSANVRYFVTNNLAVAGSLGFGLGLINIGVDYKF